MWRSQQQVADFMKNVCQVKTRFRPSHVSEKEQLLCISLIQEEFGELTKALWHLRSDYRLVSSDNPPEKMFAEIADGIGDLIYVVLYTANVYGIDIEPIFEEIQRSNMTKVGGTIREDGKLIKPNTYEPVNLEPIILRQLQNVE